MSRMTNGEMILRNLMDVEDALKSGDLAPLLLKAAHSEMLNPTGELYGLWCDGCGDCCACASLDCDDVPQLSCIRRFLQRSL